MFTPVMVTVQADRDDGSPGHPAGATPVSMPPGPNSLQKRGVSRLLREPLAGTTVQTLPGTPGHLQAWFSQVKCMNRLRELGVFLAVFRLTSEKPVVRTHLRPPEETRSDYKLILIRPIPGSQRGTTGACCRARSACRSRW